MKEGCSNTAKQIKREEAFGAEVVFQNRPEHPQGKHITEEVHESAFVIGVYPGHMAMHKQMRNELPKAKIVRLPMVERQIRRNVYALTAQYYRGQKKQTINNEQVFYHNGQDVEA